MPEDGPFGAGPKATEVSKPRHPSPPARLTLRDSMSRGGQDCPPRSNPRNQPNSHEAVYVTHRQRMAVTFAAIRPAALLLVAISPCLVHAAVPKPADMGVDIVVSGRTTTARNVEVVCTGNDVPDTFASTGIQNTPGFAWWVSRHYALKTDYPDERARHYLTLLEMAYPHYVQVFGREIPGIAEKRMLVCYASSIERLRTVLKSDGIPWAVSAGGITFEGVQASYMYPSGSLQYHQRYILLHECTHLFQMGLNGTCYTAPDWFGEGVADAVASHVYEAAARRLTVHVMDKPTTHDYFDEAVEALARRPLTARDIHDQGGQTRGLSFVAAQFFLTDPDRGQKIRLYRDEMFHLGRQNNKAASDRLIQELFGPWDKINAEFRAWMASFHNTFHFAEWGWEQDGDTLWSYGFAKHGRLSETDVYLPPGQKRTYHPLRMDYPLAPMSPLVGPVACGTAEPSVGALVDFSRNPRHGRAGIGMGLVPISATRPIGGNVLFADEAGQKPGVTATAYRLDKIAGQGEKPEDVKNGPRLGETHDAAVAIELAGSITQGLRNNFAVEWSGWLRAEKEAVYTFVLTSDDGSWLWIDGNLVVDNGGTHNALAMSGNVRLAAGMHRVQVRYFQADGVHAFEASMMVGARPGCLRLLIEAEADLVIDGTDLGMERKAVAIPQNVRDAMAADGHRGGMTARILKGDLEVMLRARDPKATAAVEFKASVPLAEAERARLLAGPLAILARDGYHGVTPYFDDCRRPEPDLNVPAPPNRWRNPGDRQLEALYRAAWRLKDKSPPSLESLKAAMLAAVDKGPDAQRAALAAFEKSLAGILKDIESCDAAADAKSLACKDLQPFASPGSKP